MKIPTEPIGSIPRPDYLLKGMAAFAKGQIDAKELSKLSDQATKETIVQLEKIQGEVNKDFFFVQKGCLRLYSVKDGIEVSVWFAFSPSSAIEVYSFVSEKPSEYFLQAIEDSEVLYLPKAELKTLYISQPKMQEMMRNFWEAVLLDLIDRFTALQRDSAEKRYLDLLNKPGYLETIPQKYLASFLGVTPTSLSRIRKQITKDHKLS